MRCLALGTVPSQPCGYCKSGEQMLGMPHAQPSATCFPDAEVGWAMQRDGSLAQAHAPHSLPGESSGLPKLAQPTQDSPKLPITDRLRGCTLRL